MAQSGLREALSALGRLDLLVFDFDGVMTANTVYITADGEEMVRCHRGDGLGVEKLHKRGVAMVILSTEQNAVVRARAAKLKLECHHGLAEKGASLAALIAQRQLDASRVIYIGNDENDLTCLASVGLPVVVADAHASVVERARVRLSNRGGEGAVRELADEIASAIDDGRLKVAR